MGQAGGLLISLAGRPWAPGSIHYRFAALEGVDSLSHFSSQMGKLAVFSFRLPVTLHSETHHVQAIVLRGGNRWKRRLVGRPRECRSDIRPRNRQRHSKENIDILSSPEEKAKIDYFSLITLRLSLYRGSAPSGRLHNGNWGIPVRHPNYLWSLGFLSQYRLSCADFPNLTPP